MSSSILTKKRSKEICRGLTREHDVNYFTQRAYLWLRYKPLYMCIYFVTCFGKH